MDAMTDAADPPERLDIEVQHVAEVGPFIAADRLRWGRDPLQAEPPIQALTVDRGTPRARPISQAGTP